MRSNKENFLIAGIICLVSGAFFTVAGLYAFSTTGGIGGLILFILGMSAPAPESSMTEEEIKNWKPNAQKMADAGRIMYRVDTTIDKPYKTTILCGACGFIGEVDGKRPASYTCSNCNTMLWEEEEE